MASIAQTLSKKLYYNYNMYLYYVSISVSVCLLQT